MASRHSVVCVATRYGMDGPRIESRWEEDFTLLSRPALGPNQLPIKFISFAVALRPNACHGHLILEVSR